MRLSACTTELVADTHRLVNWKMFRFELNTTQGDDRSNVRTSWGLTLV